jgi:hypothetical protein
MKRFMDGRVAMVISIIALGSLPSTPLSAGYWQIDEQNGWPWLAETNLSEHEAQWRWTKNITYLEQSVCNLFLCIGQDDCQMGCTCEVDSMATAGNNNHEVYSTGFGLQGWCCEDQHVKFVWHTNEGEPSPGIVLSWDFSGSGDVSVYGNVSSSPTCASAHSQGEGWSTGGGDPGDEYGTPGGSAQAVGTVTCPNGYHYSSSNAYGYPGGDYVFGNHFDTTTTYGADASWAMSGDGAYQSAPGVGVFWVSAGGAGSASVTVTMSVSEQGHDAYAQAHAYAWAQASYYVSASKP